MVIRLRNLPQTKWRHSPHDTHRDVKLGGAPPYGTGVASALLPLAQVTLPGLL